MNSKRLTSTLLPALLALACTPPSRQTIRREAAVEAPDRLIVALAPDARRDAVVKRLEDALTEESRATEELSLLSEVFGETALRPKQPKTLDAWFHAARRNARAPLPGDLVRFDAGKGAPGVGVVLRVHSRGLHVAAVLEGQLRALRVDPTRPDLRRDKRGVVNSFVRVARPGDGPETLYLAGQAYRGSFSLLN